MYAFVSQVVSPPSDFPTKTLGPIRVSHMPSVLHAPPKYDLSFSTKWKQTQASKLEMLLAVNIILPQSQYSI
jgi:hypothetical protein